MKRREFLASAGVMASSTFLSAMSLQGADVAPSARTTPTEPAAPLQEAVPDECFQTNCPIRRITSPTCGRMPFHWGAYYDQVHFDPTGRYVISNEVGFEGRSPLPNDRINVAVIDTQENDRWQEIGSSVSWNWQQGCMLQWIPGGDPAKPEVVWNDRIDNDPNGNDQSGGKYISNVFCPSTGERRQLPGPVYALAPSGEFAVSPDFARLNDTRPGYGYCGLPDRNFDVLAPQDAGITRMDLKTGETKLLFTFDDVVKMAPEEGYSTNAKHWFNHLIVSPDSRRFLFLHRWRGEEEKSWWKTRLLTANVDGSDIRIINPYGMTSHLVWRDPEHIIAFARQPSHGNRLYIFDALTGQSEVVADEAIHRDPHVSFIPGTNQEWILNDSYPDKERFQQLFLYHLPSRRLVTVGKFYQPKRYAGEWRCDLHPRCSCDGKKVLIDSTHENMGRQIYLLDISELMNWK